jgi:hypothetical protein
MDLRIPQNSARVSACCILRKNTMWCGGGSRVLGFDTQKVVSAGKNVMVRAWLPTNRRFSDTCDSSHADTTNIAIFTSVASAKVVVL